MAWLGQRKKGGYMARVKSEKTLYRAEGRLKEFTKLVTIEPQSGTFTIKMPMEIAVATGESVVHGKTLSEVESEYARVAKDYNSSEYETAKVICYDFDYYSDSLEPANCTHNNSGLMIEVRSGVYLEHKGTAKSGKISYKYELQPSRLKYDVRSWDMRHDEEYRGKLLWSKELEDFFFHTQESMESIIKRMDQLSKPAKSLSFAMNQKLIEAGQESNRG